jgi:2-iminobutanoate/2-iminopropanoate deaminase
MKTVIATDAGARPVRPYSQAIRANGLIFVSGQIPVDPETGAIVDGGIAAQTDRALRNVAAILTAAGLSMDKVVRCIVFLKNMSDFSSMNEVYATFFRENPPARTTVTVADLPKDALIEIQVTAVE